MNAICYTIQGFKRYISKNVQKLENVHTTWRKVLMQNWNVDYKQANTLLKMRLNTVEQDKNGRQMENY